MKTRKPVSKKVLDSFVDEGVDALEFLAETEVLEKPADYVYVVTEIQEILGKRIQRVVASMVRSRR